MSSKIAKILCALAFLFSTQALAGDKSVNIRINPLGLLFGTANVGADFGVTDNITLGGQVSYISLSSGSSEATAYSYGVRGQYFVNQVFSDSWYFALSGDFMNADAKNTLTTQTASVSGTTFAALAGYMWIWDNFNIMFGFGLQSISVEDDSTATSIDFSAFNGTYPALEFNLGWAF